MQAKDSWGRSLWRINVFAEQFAIMARQQQAALCAA